MTTFVALRAPSWHRHAACRYATEEADWTDAEPGSKAAADCKAICSLCPVRINCAITALSTNESYGVWGGMDQAEREALQHTDTRVAA